MAKKKEEKKEGKFSRNQLWGALRASWTGYRVARVKESVDDQIKYAKRIKSIRKQLHEGGHPYDVDKFKDELVFENLEKLPEWKKVSAD